MATDPKLTALREARGALVAAKDRLISIRDNANHQIAQLSAQIEITDESIRAALNPCACTRLEPEYGFAEGHGLGSFHRCIDCSKIHDFKRN